MRVPRAGYVAACLVLPLTVLSAETGRQTIKGAGRTTSDEMSRESDFGGALPGLGVEVGLNWNAVAWQIGDLDFSGQSWSPEASVTWGLNNVVDIRFTAKHLAAEDDGETMTGDIQASRLGIGARAWIPVPGDFIPYTGGRLNYYVFDVKDGDDATGMFGLSGEIGVAYFFTEFFSLQLGIHAETSLNSGSVTVSRGGDENDEDVSLGMAGIGLTVGVLF